MVQATSPFTSKDDFNLLIKNINSNKYDPLVACCILKKFRWNEDSKPLDYEWDSKPIRQDYKGLLVEAGAFYASKIKCILENKQLISGKVGIIELSSEESLLEIDEQRLDYCRKIFGNKK